MTRRGLLQALLPAAMFQQTAPEVVPVKGMDKHCPVCGIKGERSFYHVAEPSPVTLTGIYFVSMFLCQQCGCIFGYDKNDAGKR